MVIEDDVAQEATPFDDWGVGRRLGRGRGAAVPNCYIPAAPNERVID